MSRVAPPSTVMPAGLDPEWSVLRAGRPNVLITGSAAAVDGLIAALRPFLRIPLHRWEAGTVLPAPKEAATLLISDVGTLSPEQQQTLLSWLDDALPGQPQVVSTTALELFSLVQSGTFLEALYYRLNAVRLDAPGA
jgi:hypothetical protein